MKVGSVLEGLNKSGDLAYCSPNKRSVCSNMRERPPFTVFYCIETVSKDLLSMNGLRKTIKGRLR